MLCADIALGDGLRMLVLRAMSAHIIQRVREQPDKGYRKSLMAYFAEAPGCGGQVTLRLDGSEVIENIPAVW